MNEPSTKYDRIRLHWICLRRDCHHAWFHLKGIGRELRRARRQRELVRSGQFAGSAPALCPSQDPSRPF